MISSSLLEFLPCDDEFADASRSLACANIHVVELFNDVLQVFRESVKGFLAALQSLSELRESGEVEVLCRILESVSEVWEFSGDLIDSRAYIVPESLAQFLNSSISLIPEFIASASPRLG